MHARYRRAASIAVAMTILLGLPLVGGAWLSSPQVVDPTLGQPEPNLRAADAVTGTPSVEATELAASATEVADSALPPDPPPGDSLEDWVCAVDPDHDRCQPSKIAAAIPAVAAATSVPPPSADAPAAQPAVQEIRPLVPDAPSIDRTIPIQPESAEDWRPLISLFFAAGDVDRAVEVVQCESRGRPDAKNPRSTASGLFQHLASLWPERADKAGYADADVFDPVANTAVAAWLVYEGGGWRHWNASRGCWN